MRNFFRRKTSNRGWTLVELMMVVAMIGLIVPSLMSLFQYSYQGMAAAEIHLQLKALNEQMMLHLHQRINTSKHMFQNNAASGGLSFIGQINMGTAPASVTMSQLPLAQSATHTFSPAAGAVSSEFGNCLFYAAYDTTQSINNVSYVAPLTICGGMTMPSGSKSTTVTDGDGKAVTMNLDVYRFYYDYLSTAGDLATIPNLTSYWLIEWQSVQFVDAFELIDIKNTDSTLFTNVVSWLTTAGNFPSNQAITLAWDPSQSQMVNGTNYAFYTLSGGTTVGNSNLSIPMQSWTPLSRTSSGQISHFFYGISGNYANLAGDPPPPNVPMFAPPNTVATGFPGGFEVGIQGANGGMQVMIRSLLIAKGNTKGNGVLWDNETSVNSCRDVW